MKLSWVQNRYVVALLVVFVGIPAWGLLVAQHPAPRKPQQQQITPQQEACASEVMKAHVAAKAALTGQPSVEMLSVERTLTERRMNEKYCLQFVACISDFKPEENLTRAVFGSRFKTCLEGEEKSDDGTSDE